MEVERSPHKTTILYVGSSMSFHVHLVEGHLLLGEVAKENMSKGMKFESRPRYTAQQKGLQYDVMLQPGASLGSLVISAESTCAAF